MKIFKILILLILFFVSNSVAQEIIVKADVDTSVITVGDQIHYSFIVEYDPMIQVLEPNVLTAIVDSAGCEILSDERFPVIEKDGKNIQEWKYTLTKWEVEEVVIPEVPVKYLGADSTEKQALSNAIRLRVVSVIAPGDSVTDIKGLKAQATIPKSYFYLLWVSLALIILGAGIYGFMYWRKKRAANQPIFRAPEPVIPPEDIAYTELNRIEELHLWEKDELKEHYDLVSDCIRRYIEDRYKVDALELTTYELSRKLPKVVEKREHWQMIKEMLEESDLVKFAKHKPEAGFAKRLLDHARKIVKETTPVFKLFDEEEGALAKERE